MKNLILTILTFMSSAAFAQSIHIEFIGACSAKPLLEANISSSFENVGAATIATLEKFEVIYLGSEAGLNSAFGTPIGMDALEVISDQEMRSYGWCYKVDGTSPEVYPDQVSVAQVQRVTWFFGFAHFLNGAWVSQCEPAFKIKPAFLCAKPK